MKLLVHKVLRESFSTYQVEQTILVYLKLGRQYDKFKIGSLRILLTDCVEKDCENEYKKKKKQEEKDMKQSYNDANTNPTDS